MLILPKYAHTGDLPVLSPETPVVFFPTAKLVEEAEGDEIVRAVRVEVPRKLGKLANALAYSDEGLREVAESCGATLLEHEWALYPFNKRRSAEYHAYRPPHSGRLGVPKDHIVVARIPKILNTENLWNFRNADQEQRINTGFVEFLRRHKGWRAPIPSDIGLEQFITPRTSPKEGLIDPADVILADFEARWECGQGRYRHIRNQVEAQAMSHHRLRAEDQSQRSEQPQLIVA